MKKRFRHLIRSGWHLAEVPRSNLWQWQEAQLDKNLEWGSNAHYRCIRTWCNNTFVKDTWEGRVLRTETKEFIFQNEKDKTLFLLKWGS